MSEALDPSRASFKFNSIPQFTSHLHFIIYLGSGITPQPGMYSVLLILTIHFVIGICLCLFLWSYLYYIILHEKYLQSSIVTTLHCGTTRNVILSMKIFWIIHWGVKNTFVSRPTSCIYKKYYKQIFKIICHFLDKYIMRRRKYIYGCTEERKRKILILIISGKYA